jgi:hypothetical protein
MKIKSPKNIMKLKVFKDICSKEMNYKQMEHISKILSRYTMRSRDIKIIARFCEYDVDGDWEKRFFEVLEFIRKYGNIQNKESYILKYGDHAGLIKYEEYCNRKKNNKQSFIRRYGSVDGVKRYKSFCEKNRGNKKISRFIEKYGEKEGELKFEELQYKEKNKGTLDYKIKLHGDIKGREIYDRHVSALKHGASREGFIAKYGEAIGLIKLRQSKDNTSLRSFQKRYGDDAGAIKYNEYITKNTYSRSLSGYIDVYGEKVGVKMYEERQRRRRSPFSQISQELFKAIDDSKSSYYATKNREFVTSNGNGGSYFYDYVDVRTKKIIEFNGDIFHGNPKIYTKKDTPNPFDLQLTCEEMWYKDTIKNQFIESKGYRVFVVWEKDYREDKFKVEEECRRFLYD